MSVDAESCDDIASHAIFTKYSSRRRKHKHSSYEGSHLIYASIEQLESACKFYFWTYLHSEQIGQRSALCPCYELFS